MEVQADDRTLELRQGQMIFHKPDEFHSVRVQKHHKPPNLIVIAFECASPAMAYFRDRTMSVTDRERDLFSLLLTEGTRAFLPPWGDPAVHTLVLRPEAPFGSEQAMKAYLELLLISLIRLGSRSDGTTRAPAKLSSLQKENAEKQLISSIMDYMGRRIAEPLSLDQLCREFHLGKSRLKELFQSQLGVSVLEHFKRMKAEEAKSLIREERYNFTQIAEKLGYASIHYFSRDFKKMTGMPPSEYARTVKARSPG
ncbi:MULTISPECIES: helix-turn-helix transcriptional regulator [Paenibacillus]|uniref:helix-turn-helix transcriptional regulator n=1 Tax=Paenibacillus TaxID=44249 RepID=UPI0022B8C9B4|nr:AraC family transcriptional regulator [Paenibacillus caseinilyticus]MCZ8518265.1 AraC family transcriptional regulator [Paenibacillus caseinilyticus]